MTNERRKPLCCVCGGGANLTACIFLFFVLHLTALRLFQGGVGMFYFLVPAFMSYDLLLVAAAVVPAVFLMGEDLAV